MTLRTTLIVLGIETSCDETGVAIYDSERGLLADALFSPVLIRFAPSKFRRHSTVVPRINSATDPLGRCFFSMPQVKLKENEPFDVALRRFKRSCEKAGILAEVRRREFYEKPTAVRKRKAAAAVKRHAKKLQRENRRSQRLY